MYKMGFSANGHKHKLQMMKFPMKISSDLTGTRTRSGALASHATKPSSVEVNFANGGLCELDVVTGIWEIRVQVPVKSDIFSW
jgi:hypothetical protein